MSKTVHVVYVVVPKHVTRISILETLLGKMTPPRPMGLDPTKSHKTLQNYKEYHALLGSRTVEGFWMTETYPF